MSVSREVRIGLLVSIAIVVFFTGFYYLKGSSLFSNDKIYYCVYDDIEGLQNSAAVQLRGMNVGHISQIKLQDNSGVVVAITMSKRIMVLQGTKAVLAQSDLLGGKIIKLEPGNGPGIVNDGATLAGVKEGGAIESISGELTPRLKELKGTIATLNTTLANVNNIVGEENQKKMGEAIQSIKVTADNLAKLTATINGESGQITGMIRNANSVTANLAKNNDTIQHILSNVNAMSRQLANAPIEKTFTELHSVTSELQGLMKKINNNSGSLGMLINDKAMYNNLNSTLQSLNTLLTDLKSHPGRYINVSVFGRSH
jgi:phospholipid/cholesterol/gamma-HCH transport system substrate-binding protein